jgi:hypothetical protein
MDSQFSFIDTIFLAKENKTYHFRLSVINSPQTQNESIKGTPAAHEPLTKY